MDSRYIDEHVTLTYHLKVSKQDSMCAVLPSRQRISSPGRSRNRCTCSQYSLAVSRLVAPLQRIYSSVDSASPQDLT